VTDKFTDKLPVDSDWRFNIWIGALLSENKTEVLVSVFDNSLFSAIWGEHLLVWDKDSFNHPVWS
jgi:hypothetical protein